MFANGINSIITKLKTMAIYPIPLYYIPLSCSFYFFPRETFMVGTSFWFVNSLNKETKRREKEGLKKINDDTYEDTSEDESETVVTNTKVNDKTSDTCSQPNEKTVAVVDDEVSDTKISETGAIVDEEQSDTCSLVDETTIDTVAAVHDDNIRFDNNSSVTVNDEDALPQVAESKDEYSDDEEELPQDEDSEEDMEVQSTGWWFFNQQSKEKVA